MCAHFVFAVSHSAQGIEHGCIGKGPGFRPYGREKKFSAAGEELQLLQDLHGLGGQRHNVHLLHLHARGRDAPFMGLKIELAPFGGA